MSEVIFGLDTFGDVPMDDNGVPVSHARAIRQLIDEVVIADHLGVDVFTVGEHHRPEFSVSSPKRFWQAWPPGPNASVWAPG